MEALIFLTGFVAGLLVALIHRGEAAPPRRGEVPELTPEQRRQLENLFSYDGSDQE